MRPSYDRWIAPASRDEGIPVPVSHPEKRPMPPVTPDRWTETREVFDAALRRRGDERETFLAERCAGDETLWRDVHALLEADAAAGGFIRDVVSDAVRRLSG